MAAEGKQSPKENKNSEDGPPSKRRLCSDTLLDNPLRDHSKKDDSRIEEKDHEGRVRTVEHKDGNWASFVYADTHQILSNHLNLSNLPEDDRLKKCDSYHLSLSKLLLIQYDDIQPLKKELRDLLVHYPHLTLTVDLASGLKVFVNEEKTRTFIGLNVYEENGLLANIQEGIDDLLEERNLPPFYDPPDYHISLLWALGDCSKEMNSKLEEYQDVILQKGLSTVKVPLGQLKFKSGHKIFDLPLSNY